MRIHYTSNGHNSYHRIGTLLPTILALSIATAIALPASAQTLTGYSGTASWATQNNTSYGFSVVEAAYGGQSDAYDYGLVTSVNGTATTADTIGSIVTSADGESLTGTGTVNGLDFTKTFTALSSEPILRTLLSFQNTTGSTITFDLLLQTNLGSDAGTQVMGTSSGDNSFTTADNWIVTDDADTTTADPANTHVLYSPGALAPDIVGMSVFSVSGDQGISAQFSSLSLEAGQTASFLFFARVDSTSENALAYAGNFDSVTSIRQAGLLEGLSNDQLATVRNFSSVVVPEPASIGLLTLGLGVLCFGSIVTRRRSRGSVPVYSRTGA